MTIKGKINPHRRVLLLYKWFSSQRNTCTKFMECKITDGTIECKVEIRDLLLKWWQLFSCIVCDVYSRWSSLNNSLLKYGQVNWIYVYSCTQPMWLGVSTSTNHESGISHPLHSFIHRLKKYPSLLAWPTMNNLLQISLYTYILNEAKNPPARNR